MGHGGCCEALICELYSVMREFNSPLFKYIEVPIQKYCAFHSMKFIKYRVTNWQLHITVWRNKITLKGEQKTVNS